MIDATKTILRARRKLGAPIVDIELTDEQMTSLLKDAHETFRLYANMSDMSEQKFCSIEDSWVKKYFYALCKETLGRIRGKYNGTLPIPGGDLKLDFESLLLEAATEKSFLKYAIFGEKELLKQNHVENAVLVFYLNTGNMDHGEVGDFMNHVQKKVGKIPGFKIFFLPVQGESKVECIYPVRAELDEEGQNVISRLNEYLNEITNKEDE